MNKFLEKFKDNSVTEVYKARGDAEAGFIKSLLESYGIPSLFKGKAAPSVHSFSVNGMGEVIILVPRKLAETARHVIEDNANDKMVQRPD